MQEFAIAVPQPLRPSEKKQPEPLRRALLDQARLEVADRPDFGDLLPHVQEVLLMPSNDTIDFGEWVDPARALFDVEIRDLFLAVAGNTDAISQCWSRLNYQEQTVMTLFMDPSLAMGAATSQAEFARNTLNTINKILAEYQVNA